MQSVQITARRRHGKEFAIQYPRGGHLDGKEHINGSDDIVVLRVDSPGPVNHGVRCTALLSKMYYGIRREFLEGFLEKLEVADIADPQVYVLARDFAPPATNLAWSLSIQKRILQSPQRGACQVWLDSDEVSHLKI